MHDSSNNVVAEIHEKKTTVPEPVVLHKEQCSKKPCNWLSIVKKDCNTINDHIIRSNNCRLVLYLKYENLSCKISAIQVIVIIASTVITFFETLKSQMNFSNSQLRVISISLSTFIAMSLSISRYLKMDETKEDIYKLLQNFSIAEKDLKTLKDKYKASIQNKDKHNTLPETVYRDQKNKILQEKSRIFNGFTESVTQYNTILSYNENIYYRRQILNMSFEDKINDIYEKKLQDLHSISVEQLNRYQRNELIDNALRKFFGPACCFVHRYKYNDFFKDYDIKQNKLVDQRKPTILNKICTIAYYKCNNCLDNIISQHEPAKEKTENEYPSDEESVMEYNSDVDENKQSDYPSPVSKVTNNSGVSDFTEDEHNKDKIDSNGCLWP